MKRLFVCLLCSSPFFVNAQVKKTTPKAIPAKQQDKVVMKNLLDSFSYAAGLNIAENMKNQGITELNGTLMAKAIDDYLKNKPTALTPDIAGMKLQEQLQAFAKKKIEIQKAADMAFCNENKKRPGVTTLPNGLQYEVLTQGENGASPGPNDTVVVHYEGKLVDGYEFDNSVKRGQPATFAVGGVIKGWTQVLQLMTKGAKWKVVIPSDLGYGEHGNPGGKIPGGATLVFEISLIDIKVATKIIMEDLKFPVGKYAAQPFSEKQLQQWLSDIELLPQKIEYAITNLDEHQLNTPYRDGGWTVKQVVHHVADSHMNAYIRFKLGLTEDNPTIKPYMQDLWAQMPDTMNLPINISITILHALHRRWYEVLKNISGDQWDRTVVHPEHNKQMTLWYLLGMYAWHSRHHTAHITKLRERMGW